jgi:hypothetical protein
MRLTSRCLIKKYSKEEVEGLGQAMREAFLGLVRLSSRKTTQGGEFLKKSLIEGILEKGPQVALFVKTIFDAARWDISIEDVEEQYAIEYKRQAVINVCNNFPYSHIDEPVVGDIDLGGPGPRNTLPGIPRTKFESLLRTVAPTTPSASYIPNG